METKNQQDPKQLLLTFKIIWFAILMSCGVLVFLAYMLNKGLETSENPHQNTFLVIAGMLLIASHVLPKTIVGSNPQILNGTKTDAEILAVISTGFILSLAFSEAVTLLGFLSAHIFSHDPAKILPFAAAGVLNIILLFPSEDKLNRKVAEIRSANNLK